MVFRWPTMPGSGRAQVAQQVGAIGAGIGRLGEVFEEKQARVRLDDFKLSVTKSMIELSNEIDKEQDEDKYQAMMDSAFSDLQGQIPKGMAGPLATSYLKSERAAQLKSVDVSMELRVKSRWAAGLLVTETEAIESLNPIPFFDSVDTGVANGYILEDKAAKLKQGIVPRIKEAADLAEAETVRRHAKTLETADEALDYIDANAPQKYKAGMRVAEKADRDRTEKEKVQKQQENSDDFLARIARGKLAEMPTSPDLIAALEEDRITSSQFTSLHARLTKPPTSDDPEKRFDMTRSIKEVGNGTKSIRDARDDLIRFSTGLTDSTLAGFSETLAKEFDTSQDGAYTKAYNRAEGQIVSISLSTLDQLLTGLQAAKGGEDTQLAELRLTTAKERRKLELDNLRRYDDAMLAWQKNNPDASPTEILREGTRKYLTEFAPKTLDDIRQDLEAEKKTLNETMIQVEKPDGSKGFIPKRLLPLAKRSGWKILNGKE